MSKNSHKTGPGFERKGGYASPKTPLASLPKVPAGPAPGASPSTSSSTDLAFTITGRHMKLTVKP